jgi:hypothetical protein
MMPPSPPDTPRREDDRARARQNTERINRAQHASERQGVGHVDGACSQDGDQAMPMMMPGKASSTS